VQREPGQGSDRRAEGQPRPAPSTDRPPARCPPGRHVSGRGPVCARHRHNASRRARPPMGARWCGIPRRSAARPRRSARQRLAAEIAGGAEDEGRVGPAGAAEREILVDPSRRNSGIRAETPHAAAFAFSCPAPRLPWVSEQDARTLVPYDPATTSCGCPLCPGTAPARGWSRPDFIHRSAADEIKERLKDVNRTFTAPAIVTAFPEIWGRFSRRALRAAGPRCSTSPGAHDLVMHAMALHWADDPVGQIVQCRRALVPMACSSPRHSEGETLHELRARWRRPRWQRPAG
jgi:hypothetical protein